MTDLRAAWEEVGDAIESLALKVKLHVEEQSGATAESLQSALATFGDAVKRAADGVAAALNDTALQEDARRLGSSLAAALGATFEQVAATVRAGARSETAGGEGDND